MLRMLFVNLPVQDLTASKAFFTELGFTWNDQFTNDDAACMVVEENISVMLLTEPHFQGFISGEICEPGKTETLLCLSVNSRDEVDDTVATAISAGGKPWKPSFEMGPMYGGSFQDLDGHVWELMSFDQG